MILRQDILYTDSMCRVYSLAGELSGIPATAPILQILASNDMEVSFVSYCVHAV